MKVEERKGSISGRVESGVGVLIETRGRSQQAHGFYEYMYVYKIELSLYHFILPKD